MSRQGRGSASLLFCIGVTTAVACGGDDEEGEARQPDVEKCLGTAGGAGRGVFEEEDAVAVEEAAAACTDAGLADVDCDATQFLSRDQAMCIAEQLVAEGHDEPWRVNIVFAAQTRRVIWNVDFPMGEGETRHYAIDALTGELLRRSISTEVE